MKKFWKNNKYIIISLLILLAWSIYESLKLRSAALQFQEYEYFNDLLFFVDGLISNTSLLNLQPFGPLFIMIPAICSIHEKIHSGYIKNCLTRVEYKKLFRMMYLELLKCTLIFPIFLILLFIWCGLISNNFNIAVEIEAFESFSTICGPYISNIGVFMVVYVLNLFLHSILYVNLGLAFCKKYSNILISFILSYLSFIFLELVIEIPLAYMLNVLFDAGGIAIDLSLSSVWVYKFNKINLFDFTCYSAFLAIASSLIIYLLYRSKEGVINAIEKEN